MVFFFFNTNPGVDPAPAASGGRRRIAAFDQTLAAAGSSPPLPRGATSWLATRLAQEASEAGFTSSAQYVSIASVEATPGNAKPCFDA